MIFIKTCPCFKAEAKEEKKRMGKIPQEWLKQADYDMKTAEIMFEIKGTFMPFLSVIYPYRRDTELRILTSACRHNA